MRRLTCLSRDFPDNAIDAVVLDFVKDAIRADQDVVKVVAASYFVSDLGLTSYDALNTPEMGQFSLAVTESTADRETTREDAVGSHEGVLFVVAIFGRGHFFLTDLLGLSCWETIFHHGLCLIDVTTILDYSTEFERVLWLVIS